MLNKTVGKTRVRRQMNKLHTKHYNKNMASWQLAKSKTSEATCTGIIPIFKVFFLYSETESTCTSDFKEPLMYHTIPCTTNSNVTQLVTFMTKLLLILCIPLFVDNITCSILDVLSNTAYCAGIRNNKAIQLLFYTFY